MRKIFIKFILPVLIIALALAVAFVMIKSRKAPKRIAPVSQGPMVETMIIRHQDLPVVISATGTVTARQRIEVIPQVSGVVERISPRLVEGGFFEKGETFLKIEEADYVLALEQARADLAKAELDLALIEGKAEIARREWQLLREQQENEPMPLVVYEPQLASAKADVASAQAKVELAELNLARTTMRAPFNCFIRTKEVDIGQYLRAGTMVLELVGTDAVEVVVPFSLDDLAWLEIPDVLGSGKGSPATVTMSGATHGHQWQGFVSRTVGEVDSQTRMLDAVIVIDDPYQLANDTVATPELVVGSFVQVEVEGRLVPQVARIPRSALHGADQVWLVDDNNELVLRQVEVARKEKDTVLITGGLQEGERLMLTTVSGAANGMKVRISGEATP